MLYSIQLSTEGLLLDYTSLVKMIIIIIVFMTVLYYHILIVSLVH